MKSERRFPARAPGPSAPVTFGRILAILIAFFVVAVAGFMILERLTLADAIYLAVATMTTVGYGDIVPGTPAGRWFTVVVMLGGVSIGFYAVGTLAALLVEGRLGRLVEERRMRKQIEDLRDHFVICGFGEVGVRLVSELVRSEAPFVVVERDPSRAQAARDQGYLVVEGDATDDAVLAQVRVERARGLATVINDDAENLYITASTRALNPSIAIVARGSRLRGRRYLTQAGATSVVYLDDLGAIRMARSLMHPDVVTFLEEMMSPARGDAQLEAMKLPPGCPAAGKTLKELNLRARLGIQILAVKREGRYLANPAPEEKLRGEDVLLVVGPRDQIVRLEEELDRGGT